VTDTATAPRVWPSQDEWLAILDKVGAAVLSGLLSGLLIGGVGGRLAMFVLRLTSPDALHGAETDDGFTIGEFSGETLFLLAIAALAGIVLALAYLTVRRWLPARRRPLQGAVLAGLLGGALIVNPGGIDFTLLEPLGLAVAMFVALPALYGAATVALTEWLLVRPGRWRPARVAAIVLFAVIGFFGLVGAVIAVVGFGAYFAARRWPEIAQGAASPAVTWVVRGLLLVGAALCAVDLWGDATEIL
jgi:hypothetical protein